MNLRSGILLVVALVLGIGFAQVTKSILNSIPEKETETTVVEEKMVPTLLAKRDLLPGDEITPQNIRFDLLPESQVPNEAVNHYTDAKHRIVTKRVGKGELISIYDLNDPENVDSGYYTPLNSSCVSFQIGSVVGRDNTGKELLKNICENIVPGVDKVDFLLTSEKQEENSPNGTKPLQRTSMVSKLLGGVEIHRVRTVPQQESELDSPESRLEISFILSNTQRAMLEEALARGRVTIELAADSTEEELQEGSPLFEIEPSVVPVEVPAPIPEEKEPVPPTSAVLPASGDASASVQTAELETTESSPAVNASRPRRSIPRPDATL